MDGLISVIVNVYNCKEFLPVSLESVRQQTYSRLEVILVDDCSSDGSGEYCEEFCRKDERFRVIHHERNTGVSGPRNTGLREARGEYIYFLDGDDYLHAEALEALMDALRQTGADLAVFDFQRTDSLREDTHRPREKKPVETVPAERLAYEMLACVELKWCVSWNKLFKRSLLAFLRGLLQYPGSGFQHPGVPAHRPGGLRSRTPVLVLPEPRVAAAESGLQREAVLLQHPEPFQDPGPYPAGEEREEVPGMDHRPGLPADCGASEVRERDRL